jgi:SAM-dependent methyltransferase
MEHTPFSDGSFDTVVLLDVLEHVAGERETLDEIYRILAPGGRLILTVPHAGLFAFLDIDNVALAIRKYAPALYDALFYLKERRMPERRPGYENWHRHYTYEALSALLTSSRFARGFAIERVRYCGLIMDAVVSIAYQAARALLGFERANAVLAALNPLYSADYAVDYGRLSYNIALCVTKTASRA